MAYGRSLELAKIQPPEPRLVHNSARLGPYVSQDKQSEQALESARLKVLAHQRQQANERKVAARIAARTAAGITDPIPMVDRWPSVDHYELDRMNAAAEQTLRARKRWWRTNWARVRRLFSWLGEVSQ